MSSVFQRPHIALARWTRSIFIVFEKLTHACFTQITLETMLFNSPITYDVRN